MALNKGEKVKVEGDEKAGYDGIIERVDRIDKLVKNPEFLKIVNDIIAQPADKRQSFVEKAFDRDELNKKGVMLKGSKIKFKPASDEKGAAKSKRLVTLNIKIPEVGSLILRGKY